MPQPDHKLQKRIREYENPTFGYRRGEDGGIEKDIFEGEPLPEGWADSPAKVDGESRAPVDFATVSTEVPRTHVGVAPPYEAHTFNVLRAEFKRRTGAGPPPSTNKPTLIQMLKDLDAPPEPEPDADE